MILTATTAATCACCGGGGGGGDTFSVMVEIQDNDGNVTQTTPGGSISSDDWNLIVIGSYTTFSGATKLRQQIQVAVNNSIIDTVVTSDNATGWVNTNSQNLHRWYLASFDEMSGYQSPGSKTVASVSSTHWNGGSGKAAGTSGETAAVDFDDPPGEPYRTPYDVWWFYTSGGDSVTGLINTAIDVSDPGDWMRCDDEDYSGQFWRPFQNAGVAGASGGSIFVMWVKPSAAGTIYLMEYDQGGSAAPAYIKVILGT